MQSIDGKPACGYVNGSEVEPILNDFPTISTIGSKASDDLGSFSSSLPYGASLTSVTSSHAERLITFELEKPVDVTYTDMRNITIDEEEPASPIQQRDQVTKTLKFPKVPYLREQLALAQLKGEAKERPVDTPPPPPAVEIEVAACSSKQTLLPQTFDDFVPEQEDPKEDGADELEPYVEYCQRPCMQTRCQFVLLILIPVIIALLAPCFACGVLCLPEPDFNPQMTARYYNTYMDRFENITNIWLGSSIPMEFMQPFLVSHFQVIFKKNAKLTFDKVTEQLLFTYYAFPGNDLFYKLQIGTLQTAGMSSRQVTYQTAGERILSKIRNDIIPLQDQIQSPFYELGEPLYEVVMMEKLRINLEKISKYAANANCATSTFCDDWKMVNGEKMLFFVRAFFNLLSQTV